MKANIKVVTFGEVLMRLSTPNFKRIVQTESFEITYGGGEANVAAALCNYGLKGVFVSKVPDNPLGQSAINHLQRFGVNTQFIVKGDGRLGLYFLETGASMRASQVTYDRANASITKVKVADFDFDAIFEGVNWFHTSGITPALSDAAAAITLAALKTARSKGITTSMDLNYRKKLWSAEKAKQVLVNLCQYVDVCIGADPILGFTAPDCHIENGIISMEGFKDIFLQLKANFGFKFIATSLRVSHSASDNSWGALVYDGNQFYQTKEYKVRIVDRVGTGDSFAAGLIFGLVTGMNMNQAAEFAVLESSIKHTIPGDLNHVTLDEYGLNFIKYEG